VNAVQGSRADTHTVSCGCAASASAQVLALWLLALPFIMFAAALYQQAASVSFREAMYKVGGGCWVWVWIGVQRWAVRVCVSPDPRC
jgi:ABC-type phosphate transport system permease subunit